MKSLDEITAHVSSMFVHAEEQCKAFHFCSTQNEHAILWGNPGYGKSDIIKAFLRFAYGDSTYFMNVTRGIEKAELLGGLDMKALLEEGRMNYLIDYSFLKKKGVFFDELMDAPPARLAILKNIFTEGGLWSEGKFTAWETETIFAATNHKPSEWAGAEATNVAILDRFAVQIKVEWPKHDMEDFEQMFSRRLGKPYTAVAECCALCHQRGAGKRMTPRTAIKVAKAYDKFGALAFRFLGDLDEGLLEEIERTQRFAAQRQSAREVFSRVEAKLNTIDNNLKLKGPSTPTIEVLAKFGTILVGYREKLRNMPMDNALLKKQAELSNRIASLETSVTDYMLKLVKFNPSEVETWKV